MFPRSLMCWVVFIELKKFDLLVPSADKASTTKKADDLETSIPSPLGEASYFT